MNHDLFAEMEILAALDPSDTTDDQEDRLSDLLALHDSGMTYPARDMLVADFAKRQQEAAA